MPAIITGWGHCAPPGVLTNDDLATIMDTNDEWIVERTGIRQRHCSHVSSGELGRVAGARAIACAGLEPADIDAIIFASVSPELLIPSTASLVQKRLGIRDAAAMDLNVGCSGFIYGLSVANGLVTSGVNQRVLLIASERLTWYLDWTLRDTAVLFGDGAGAVVLSRDPEIGGGDLMGVRLGADGKSAPLIHMPGGGSRVPASAASIEARQHFLKMNGREVFKLAVRAMVKGAREILAQCDVDLADVGCVIPHQANIRIIESVASHLKLPLDLFPNNVQHYGNTSAASVPLALDEAIRSGRISDGEYVLMIAFGAGLSWGSTLMKWQSPKT